MAVPARQGGTDGAGDVVTTRSDFCDQGTQHIEGCFAALLHLLFDIELDLIHRHVARTLHHHLHIVFPGPAGEFTKGFQLGPSWAASEASCWQPGRCESSSEKLQS
jgi:hypothetical protein